MSAHGRLSEIRPGAVRKDLRPLLRLAREQGWQALRLSNNHIRWVSPTGTTVHSSSQLNTPAVLRIVRRDLVRAGLRIDADPPAPKEKPMSPAATTSLGAAIEAARTVAAEVAAKPNGHLRVIDGRGVGAIVEEAVRREPERQWKSEDLVALVARVKDVSVSATYLAIKGLWLAGVLHKEGRGQYRIKTSSGAATAAAAATPASAFVAGARTGDAATDQDLEELDEALAALARIEAMIRRHRTVVKQLADLKRTLAGISL